MGLKREKEIYYKRVFHPIFPEHLLCMRNNYRLKGIIIKIPEIFFALIGLLV